MLIVIWELAYRIGVGVLGIWKPYTFPSPFSVFTTLVELIGDNTLGIAIAASLKRIAAGYFISVVIGMAMGLVIVRFKYLDENLSAIILGLQTLPSICWLPFAILWYGLNESAIIFVIAVGSTFAVTIAIESGIKNVNPLYVRAARTMGASGLKAYWNVIIPAALPGVISGLKQGWSFAWRALMAGEMMSATKGLGQVLMVGRDLADISQVMAVMVVIIVLGLAVDKLAFGRLEANVRQKWGLDRA
ncbi:NitT/TauT family transport system permease protein [Anaerobacterium chartisolvens]|uniref:NitT/TauT family transport system permease protein n=1 Tax=Anaerobacterium chartisolvens TaxID=1297424 RepID=A0A369B9M1_9FIRM|nr:ABC transporter permease [Anaerobacterium chartisolvens]RCX17256.1 NitT/TauT family transport system permease protein [Anaerobacterium chartisolvens]